MGAARSLANGTRAWSARRSVAVRSRRAWGQPLARWWKLCLPSGLWIVCAPYRPSCAWKKLGGQRLEAACTRALHFADPRYRRIKQILNAAMDREPLPEMPTPVATHTFAFARSPAEFFPATEEVQA
jgi:hypothetical protein